LERRPQTWAQTLRAPPTGRKAENEQLQRNVNELLQELRVAQAGVQFLFGFLLAVAFTEPVLLAADGVANTEIAQRMRTSRPTVLKWRDRYAESGIDALVDLPRPGRQREIDEVAVLAETLTDKGKPPSELGVTHWSSRLMADRLAISFASVARIWRKWNIQPHRIETFKFSTDPELEPKIRDVVGLYLAPPKGAVVVSVDESGRDGAR
jgi:transposase